MTATLAPQTASLGPTEPIPESHLDLIVRPITGVLTTMSLDGRPRSSLVWVGYDGECVTVNTSLQRWKGRDLVANPRLSLLVVDPANTSRFIQIRGDAELITDGAIDDLDRVTRSYTDKPCFYGYIYPKERQFEETRVICRIHARRISLDAVHRQDEPLASRRHCGQPTSVPTRHGAGSGCASRRRRIWPRPAPRDP